MRKLVFTVSIITVFEKLFEMSHGKIYQNGLATIRSVIGSDFGDFSQVRGSVIQKRHIQHKIIFRPRKIFQNIQQTCQQIDTDFSAIFAIPQIEPTSASASWPVCLLFLQPLLSGGSSLWVCTWNPPKSKKIHLIFRQH